MTTAERAIPQPEPNREGLDPSERYRIVGYREADLGNMSDLTSCFRLLTAVSNIEHFANPPTSVIELRDKYLADKTHVYVGVNAQGEIMGTGGINDAEYGQHDHFLVKVALHPRAQGKGQGRELVESLTDIAFTNPTRYGTERTKLDASVIRDVRGWERMPHILSALGYEFRSHLPDQVDVFDRRTQQVVTKPTERWEVLRYKWIERRAREVNIAPTTTIN